MKLNTKILEIFSFFKQVEENEKVYLVGGAVRDLLLNKEPKDLDFAFEGSAILFCRKFINNENIKNFHISSHKFESCSFSYEGYEISFNSCRKDIYEKNKLKIEKSSIQEDLKRRDFTINAIALSLELKLIDPLNGSKDLSDKKIKIINDESFSEDPSRLIRAVRYIFKLRFDFDKETKKRFNSSLKLLDKNSNNIRIVKELNRTLSELSPYILSDEYFKEILKNLNSK